MKKFLAAGLCVLVQAVCAQEMSCCGKLPSRFAPSAPEGMVWIPAGEFIMGSTDNYAKPDEQPLRKVKLDGFWISRTPITNKQFEEFVNATGYVTTAERAPTVAEILS